MNGIRAEEVKKGSFKRLVGKLEIASGELSHLIVLALLEKGYDVESTPVLDNQYMQRGETLTITRMEQRY